jgi:nicotinic acid mononucleotide adenylyltransferase
MDKLSVSLAQEKGALYFIAGGDSLMEVKSWRQSEKLLASYNFIFVVRPGTDLAEYRDALAEQAVARVCDLTGLKRTQIRRKISEGNAGENRIFIVDVGAPDISATRIRNLASSGKPVQRMVSGPVNEYIRKLHLYGER